MPRRSKRSDAAAQIGCHKAVANATFYYFGYDALDSQVAVLNATGSLVGAHLYGPYGASHHNTGTLPTSIGFTGQRADRVTGLDYYNARYYDPGVGQFLSVDSVQGNAQGMDPYAYVGGRCTYNLYACRCCSVQMIEMRTYDTITERTFAGCSTPNKQISCRRGCLTIPSA